MSKAADNFRQKCEALYKEADKDNNGLSVTELRTLVKTLCNHPQVSDRMIAEMFADLDDDGDKKVTWEEFSDVCKKSPKAVEASQLKELFDVYDTDKSGRLSADEVKKAFQELGIKSDPQTSLDALDRDGDGKVSCDEFVANWCQ